MVILESELAEETAVSHSTLHQTSPGALWCPSPGQDLMLMGCQWQEPLNRMNLAHVKFCSILALFLLTLRKEQQYRAGGLEPTQVLCAD